MFNFETPDRFMIYACLGTAIVLVTMALVAINLVK